MPGTAPWRRITSTKRSPLSVLLKFKVHIFDKLFA
jgi:hypothetical protein